MSTGHTHLGGPNMTQNQGNVLGDRPCVRQSRLYREQCGGNTMKDLLGQSSLKWDTNRTEGAYQGGRVYDHVSQQYEHEPTQQYVFSNQSVVEQQAVRQPQAAPSTTPYATATTSTTTDTNANGAGVHRRGAGVANRQTYNILTGN